MNQALSRRHFLQGSLAAGGLALTAACVSQQTSAIAPATTTHSVGTWRPPSDEERRASVSTAQFGRKKGVSSKNGLAICTHPLAASAATDMLRLGGNACDAIMAASITQAVVEPHMTTLSGCLSMLYFEAATGQYSYVNGMMAAPLDHPALQVKEMSGIAPFMSMTRNGGLCFVPGYWGGFESGHDA